jgi:photosystem II stability/assembly factor-like uncharacterized protein
LVIRITFLLLSVLLFNFNISSAWFAQNSGTDVALNSLYFTSLNTGYAAGDNGVILKTTNKGLNWIALNSSTGRSLYSICFTDANNGYAAGDSIILKTTDAGNSWSALQANYTMKSLHFVNSQVGYIAAYYGIILKTTNSGASWNAFIASDPDAHYTSVCFTDLNTGYVVGLSGEYIKTTDGGISWRHMPLFYQKNYFSVQFPSKSTGYIIGGWVSNMIMKSEDEGETFNYLVSGFTGVRLFSSSFLDVNKGIAVGRQGSILRTSDAGGTWVNENSGTTAILYGVQYLNENTAYAVGENGTILSTVAVIGIEPVNGNVPSQFSLSQNYPNPFNPNTKIRFDIPAANQSSDAKLVIYDVLGNEITTLINEALKPGIYEVNFSGSDLSSGTYFYTLTYSGHRETKKMLMIK